MKTKRGVQALVLGAALFGEAAHAQSSVQLYGLLDAFVGYKKPLNGQSSVIAGNGGMTAPYFGMRGVEDLGGGTSVIFDLESYFNIQNGTSGRTGFPHDGLFSRNAYVGLSGHYGTVTAGLIPPLLWFSTIQFNPFWNSFVFSPIVLHSYIGVNGQGVFGNAGEWWNSVYYASPAYRGLVGRAMYSFGNEAGHLGQNKWSGQVSYNNGGFATSVVYQQIKFSLNAGDLGTVLPGLTTQSVVNIGMSYDMGFVKLYGQYQHVWDSITTGDVGIDTGQLGFSIPVGVGRILGSDAYSKSSGNSSVYRNTWALSYDYPLSKRTDLYAAFLSDRASRMSTGTTIGGGIRTTF
ncbi:porin [Paraburkholderia solisilvae]|uniref:Outer membrane porin protein n=1 Tax=Paraburkholderia solisilvae TaxID=624376 RepID=A0A6J5D240_9BURK|nr:porin [Paraburkholderia solisilvae]CAB3747993.1 Outer membrane porin protein [Paraburkholderia solisilvae]